MNYTVYNLHYLQSSLHADYHLFRGPSCTEIVLIAPAGKANRQDPVENTPEIISHIMCIDLPYVTEASSKGWRMFAEVLIHRVRVRIRIDSCKGSN